MEGNQMKMREAVVLALSLLDLKDGVSYKTVSQKDIDFMKAALSKPQRNCDVGTPEAQARRFGAMCNKYYNDEDKCDERCPLASMNFIHGFPRCQAYWAQMPYDGGGY